MTVGTERWRADVDGLPRKTFVHVHRKARNMNLSCTKRVVREKVR